jgi:3-methyladenine DNA glycosylase AlkD
VSASSVRVRALADAVSAQLLAAAIPADAAPMAAYMKTDMPFFGVKKPLRVPIIRSMRAMPLASRDEVEAAALELWGRPHREEKYLALDLLTQRKASIVPASLPLYEHLVRDGAWWDLVDTLAIHLIGAVWRSERARVDALSDRWIDDDDLWIRRTAIIAQIRHKAETDEERLFRFCRARMHEQEFFVRKAIGWSLREYGKSAPRAVAAFLIEQRAQLSGLSYREGAKNLRAAYPEL